MKNCSVLVFKLILGFILVFYSFGCSKKDDHIACTEEFRTVQIKVIGGELDDAFTIRLSTGDTLRFDHFLTTEGNYYTVLDDSYQPYFQDNTEQFRFVGIINEEVVVDELFLLSADKCHINYISGNVEVEI